MTRPFPAEVPPDAAVARGPAAVAEDDLDLQPDREAATFDIAIVGMAGRFPGAASVEEFWNNLLEGRESIRDFTDGELESVGIGPELHGRPSYVRRGAVIGDVDHFDASLFGMTPREAEVTDPQHRLFLECAWEALEDAAVPPLETELRVGVWGGTFMSTYFFQVLSNPEVVASAGDLMVRHGNEKDYLTTRVAFRLNLKGPACTVQTACSTSLVAVHHACQALLARECDVALAGGVAIRCPEIRGYLHDPGGVLSSDGRCRPFDAAADGTVFGHGAAVVALMRADEAVARGHDIYAVIHGTAVNNDGADKMGFTAPSVDGQAAVVADALAVAGVDPRDLGYVEAHGTGTALGDPIEIAALVAAFQRSLPVGEGETLGRGFCALGSVKSNVGHLSGASGVTGLIKAALVIRHGLIPPSLNFTRPNPRIDFATSPFFVNTDLRPWPADPERPRRAGVSSFGMGGTNAHALLGEAPRPTSQTVDSDAHSSQLLLWSARSEPALERMTARLAHAFSGIAPTAPASTLADAAYTLHRGRPRLELRRFVVVDGLDDARQVLEEAPPERLLTVRVERRQRPVVFLLPGQGSQYPGMGRELYGSEPIYREAVDRVATLARPHLGEDLRQLLLGPTDDQRLQQTRYAQPAIFAVSWAMAALLGRWGIEPQALLGHSIGELTAAALAGVFTLEDAVHAICERGRLMQAMPPGSMLAVPEDAEEVERRLPPMLEIAAVNGPRSTVVSGPSEAVEAWAGTLAAEGIESRPLHTSHAFHSRLMEPAVGPFEAVLRRFHLRPPRVPFVSNVSGGWISDRDATDPAYWARQIRSPVRFADGVGTVAGEPDAVWLEVGPGTTLGAIAGGHPEGVDRVRLATLPHARDAGGDRRFLLHTAGRLWQLGVRLDGEGFWHGQHRRFLHLPTYAFDRRRYWVEAGGGQVTYGRPDGAAEATGPTAATVGYLPLWTRTTSPSPHTPTRRRWLVLADDGDPLGETLARRLRDDGGSVVLARGAGAGSVAAGNPDDGAVESLRALLHEAAGSGSVERILDLRGLQTAGSDPEMVRRSFAGLQRLARAVVLAGEGVLGTRSGDGEREPGHFVKILVGGFDVIGTERLHPAAAGWLGPALCLAQETGNLRVTVLDLDAEDLLHAGSDAAAADRMAALLLAVAEALPPASRDPVTAVRAGRLWRRAFLPASLRPDPRVRTLRPGGRYLITGGFGGLGLVLAQRVVDATGGDVQIALAGRTVLPDRDQWREADPEERFGAPVAERIRAVLELEGRGARVAPLAADVGDRASARDLVLRAAETLGELDGVFHAAGLGGGGLLQTADLDQVAAVLAPKVEGTLGLLDALEPRSGGEAAPFLVLFSSTTALSGGFGRADYTAANAFLDAVAGAHGRQTGSRVLSINFGTWAEVGMAARAGGADGDVATLPPAVALDGLFAALDAGIDRVVICAEDPARLVARRAAAQPTGGEALGAADRPMHPRPHLTTPYAAANNELERRLAAVWSAVLGVEQVGVLDNFFELGGTSLTVLQVTAGIRRDLGVEVPPVQMYESPTIRALGRQLASQGSDDEEPGVGEGDLRARGARRRERRQAGGRRRSDPGEAGA